MRAPLSHSTNSILIGTSMYPFSCALVRNLADGRASDLTIIASEFVHVHADEFAGELRFMSRAYARE